MASVTERGGRFTARVRIKGYPLVCKTFTKRADALAWARRTETDMETGRWVSERDKVPTLAEAVAQHFKAVGSKQKGGQDGYALRWDAMAALSFASKPIDEVKASDVSKWRDAMLAQGLTSNTVIRKLSHLSSVFTWSLMEREWIKSNPCITVKRPKAGAARDRVFSAAEFDYLTKAAGMSAVATWWPLAFVVLTRAAMRRSEVFGLMVGDVDHGARVALLRETKAGGSRLAPLCADSLRALAELERMAKAAGRKRLLPIESTETISDQFRATVKRAVKLYRTDCKATGAMPETDFLRGVRLHDARHHAATHWATTGLLGVFELQAITGHRSVKSLNRYVNMRAADVASKLAVIPTAQAVASRVPTVAPGLTQADQFTASPSPSPAGMAA
jgi:integrase